MQAKDATEQGFVLLRNEQKTLPFKSGGSIAVIGPHANAQNAMLGNYLGQVCPDAFGSVSCVETPFEAFQKANVGGSTVNVTGCAINTTDTSGFKEALKVGATLIH
jgi:beta-glucosidase-like glycosyl hydrolase